MKTKISTKSIKSFAVKSTFYLLPFWTLRLQSIKFFEIPLMLLLLYSISAPFLTGAGDTQNSTFYGHRASKPLVYMLLFYLMYFIYGIAYIYYKLAPLGYILWADGVYSYYVWNILYLLQVILILLITHHQAQYGNSISKGDILTLLFANIVLLIAVNAATGSLNAFFSEKGPLGQYLACLGIFYYELETKIHRRWYAVILIVSICIYMRSTRGMLLLLLYVALSRIKRIHITPKILALAALVSGVFYILFLYDVAHIALKFSFIISIIAAIIFSSASSPLSVLVQRHSVGRYAAPFILKYSIGHNMFFGAGLANYMYVRDVWGWYLPYVPHDYAGVLIIDTAVEFGIIGMAVWYYLFYRISSQAVDTSTRKMFIVFFLACTFLANTNDYLSFILLSYYVGILRNKKCSMAITTA